MKKTIIVFVVCCVLSAFADNPHITMLVELVDVALSSPSDGDVLTFESATSKWTNRHTAQGPEIVARFQIENTSGPLTVALATPTETGMYRVNWYAAMPIAPFGSIDGAILGTDELSHSVNIIQVVSSGSSGSGSGVIRDVAGSPITLTLGVAGDNPTYSIYIVVEKL